MHAHLLLFCSVVLPSFFLCTVKCCDCRVVNRERSVHSLRQGEWTLIYSIEFSLVVFNLLLIKYVYIMWPKQYTPIIVQDFLNRRENPIIEVCCVRRIDWLLFFCLRLSRNGSACVCESIISAGLGKREVSGLKHAGLFTQWQHGSWWPLRWIILC